MNQSNTNNECCNYVNIKDCSLYREKLREQSIDLDEKINNVMISLAETQQQIKMLLKVFSVLSGGVVTIATTLILNFII